MTLRIFPDEGPVAWREIEACAKKVAGLATEYANAVGRELDVVHAYAAAVALYDNAASIGPESQQERLIHEAQWCTQRLAAFGDAWTTRLQTKLSDDEKH